MGKHPYINMQNLPDDMNKHETLLSIRESLGDINDRSDINRILCSFETSEDGEHKVSSFIAIGNGFSIEATSPDDLSAKLSSIQDARDRDVFGDSARIIVKEDASCQIKTEDSNCFFSNVDNAVSAFSSDFRNDYEISTFRNSDDVRYSNDHESIVCRPTSDGDLKVISITETLEDGRKVEFRPSKDPDNCFVRETTSIDEHDVKINIEMPFSFEVFEHDEHRADVASSIDSVVNYRIDAFTEKIENVANNMSPDSTIFIRTDRDMNIMCNIETKQGEGEDRFECRANMRFDSDGEFRVTDITEKIGNDTEVRIIPTNDADTCRVIEKTTFDGHDTTIKLEVKDMNFENIVEKGDYRDAANNIETNIAALVEPNIDTFIERADALAGHFGAEDSKLTINIDREDNAICSIHTFIEDKVATFGLNESGDKIECAICTAEINNDGSDNGDKEKFTVRFDSPLEQTNLETFVFSDTFTDVIDRLADNSDLGGKEVYISEDVITIKGDGNDGYRYASVEVNGGFSDNAETITERVDTALEKISDVMDGIEHRIENRNETGVYDKFDIAASLTPEAAERMSISISADGDFDVSVRIPDDFDGQVIKDGSFLEGKVEPGEHIRSIETERHFAVDSSDTAIVKIDTGTTSIDKDGNERENIAFRVYDIESGEMLCCREYVEVSPDSPPFSVDIRMVEQEDGKYVAIVKVFDTENLTPVAEGIIDSSHIPSLDGQEMNGDTFREFIADSVADGRIADIGLVEPSVEFDGKMYMTVDDMEAKLVEYGVHFEEIAEKISEVSDKISDIRDKIADEYRSPDFNPEHLSDLKHELNGLERELSDYRGAFGGASENRDFGAINRIEKIECNKSELRELKAAIAETPKDSPKYEALQERLGELKSEIRADTGKVLQSNNILGEFVGRAIINGCNLGPRGSEIVKSIFCGRDIDLVRLIAAIRMPPDGKDNVEKTGKSPDAEITPDREFHNDNEKFPDGTDTPQIETNDNNDNNPNDNERNPDKNAEGTDGNEEGTDGNEEGADGNEENPDGNEEQTPDGNEEGTDGNEESTDGNEESTDGNEESTDGNEENTDGNEECTDSNEENPDGNGEQTPDGNEEGTDSNEDGTDNNEENADGNEENPDENGEQTPDGNEEGTDNGNNETTDNDPAVVGDGDTSDETGTNDDQTDGDEDGPQVSDGASSDGADQQAYDNVNKNIENSDKNSKDDDNDNDKKKEDDDFSISSGDSNGGDNTSFEGDGDSNSAGAAIDADTNGEFNGNDDTGEGAPQSDELTSQIAENPEEFVEPNTEALGNGEGNDGKTDGETVESQANGDGNDNSNSEELAASTEGDGTFEDPSLLEVDPVIEAATEENGDLLNGDGTIEDPTELGAVPESDSGDVFTDAADGAIPDADNTDADPLDVDPPETFDNDLGGGDDSGDGGGFE